MLDDLGRVNVAILNRPVPGTVEDAVAQRLRCHPSAAVAFLGSPARVDLRDQTTSICGFVVGERDQLAPRGIEYGLGKHAARQSSDVQVLEGDVGVAVDQGTGQLMGKVPPLVGRPGTVPGKPHLRLEPTPASPPAPAEGTLETALFPGCLSDPLRCRLARKAGADILCRRFQTGGRTAAAGIDHLPEDQLGAFVDAFQAFFGAVTV